MTDLDSTLSAIDAATGCQQCEGLLGDSPSPDFCSDACQSGYFAARSQPLMGYREPSDVPAHIHNQVELCSPETTPGRPECDCVWACECRVPGSPGQVTYDVTPDLGRYQAAMRSAVLAISRSSGVPLAYLGTPEDLGLRQSHRVQVGPEGWRHLAEAHGCTVQWTVPDDRRLWVNPVETPTAVGVELVDRTGTVVAHQSRVRVIHEGGPVADYMLHSDGRIEPLSDRARRIDARRSR